MRAIAGPQGEIVIRTSDVLPKNKKGLIVIGEMDSPLILPYADRLHLKKSNCDQIAQYAIDGNIILSGNCHEAVIFSVMDFMQTNMGIRFLWPGESGTFYGKNFCAVPGNLAKTYTPSFRYRCMSPAANCDKDDAVRFNIRNGIQDGDFRFGGDRVVGGETIQPYRSDYKKHPEWFALIKGERYLPPPTGWCWIINGCWSNREFTDVCIERIKEWIEKRSANHVSIHPADSQSRCECEKCKAMIQPDESTRWFEYHANIVREIKKEYPDLHYSVLAYQEYREVPAKKVEEVEFVEYCNYTRCFIHKIGNPHCGANHMDFKRFQKWIDSGKAPAIGLWDYTYDVFNPMYSLPVYSYFADLIQYCFKNKVMKIYFENGNGAGISRPATWVAQKMLWDASLNPETLLEDYCRTAYGPAGNIMLTYHRACAASWEAMPSHLSQCFNNPGGTAKNYLTPELIKLAEETFQKADQAFHGIRSEIQNIQKNPKHDKNELTKRVNLLNQYLDAVKFEKEQYVRWLELHDKMMKSSLAMTIYKGTGNNDFDAASVPFSEMKSQNKEIVKNTITKMYRTDDALLIRVCVKDGSKPAKEFKKEHDADGTFGPSAVELFVQPAGDNAYYHFAAARFGAYYEGNAYDGEWNCSWDFHVKEMSDGWEITYIIPFSSLNADPKDGDIWKIAVIRNGENLCGMPAPLYHDIAAGADVTFSGGKRP